MSSSASPFPSRLGVPPHHNSNDIIQHSQVAEEVIADIVNANFPDVNFPKHSTEKSANASNKRKNTDRNDFYVVYFAPVVTSGMDFSSISSGVGNSVTISTNQLFCSRVRKKFVFNAFTFQNISSKKRVKKLPKKNLSTKNSHDHLICQQIIKIVNQSHFSAQHRPQSSLISSKGKKGKYNDQMNLIIKNSNR